MIAPFLLGDILTHAGLNPLCLCCCPKDDENLGGGQFADAPVVNPSMTLNPFVQVVMGNADSDPDSDAVDRPGGETALHRRHPREGVAKIDDAALKAEAVVAQSLPGQSHDDQDVLDFIELMALVDAADDEREFVIDISLQPPRR